MRRCRKNQDFIWRAFTAKLRKKAIVEDEIEQLKLDGACNNENCVNCQYYGDCVAGEKGEELALDKAIEILKRGGLDES